MNRVALALLVLGLLVPGAVWAAEFMAVDDCLGHGHVFDYATGQCDFAAQHLPYIAFVPRHRGLIGASAVVTSCGVILLSLSRRTRDGAYHARGADSFVAFGSSLAADAQAVRQQVIRDLHRFRALLQSSSVEPVG